ncbi:hypothetical protein GCM10010345_43500 [Streptomyces canarius]|uniref:Transposase IS701-like DDE domain-containing protein n=1 Tax=Streptomyces canarius TaxID=285453 RepID=A0ABQ3CQG6_9ACTN|nr:hypothetical protein GCM10010345_43500 [Streptomyces canarius]
MAGRWCGSVSAVRFGEKAPETGRAQPGVLGRVRLQHPAAEPGATLVAREARRLRHLRGRLRVLERRRTGQRLAGQVVVDDHPARDARKNRAGWTGPFARSRAYCRWASASYSGPMTTVRPPGSPGVRSCRYPSVRRFLPGVPRQGGTTARTTDVHGRNPAGARQVRAARERSSC